MDLTLLASMVLALVQLIVAHAKAAEIGLAVFSDLTRLLSPAQQAALQRMAFAAFKHMVVTWDGPSSGDPSTDEARARRAAVVTALERHEELERHEVQEPPRRGPYVPL